MHDIYRFARVLGSSSGEFLGPPNSAWTWATHFWMAASRPALELRLLAQLGEAAITAKIDATAATKHTREMSIPTSVDIVGRHNSASRVGHIRFAHPQSAAAFHRLICSLTRPGPASEILPKPNLTVGNAAIYWAPVVPVTVMVWVR
jgi:hypothetical protein